MILAVLAALTLGTQTADAQIFLCRQTPCCCWRVGLFQRPRAWRPSWYALTAPATNGSGCLTNRAASADRESSLSTEYVPTTEGNVPAHEYLEAKKNADAPLATTFLLAANRIRARYGLPELTSDATLDAGCASQANYCASVGALIHGAGVAEILAMNSSGFDSALNQWLASPAHRAILLSGQYRVAGVAVVRDRNGRVWCAMRFR